MAIYHLTVNNGSKSNGHSGSEKNAYIERTGKYADRDDLVYYSSGNLPHFANGDSHQFWLAVDKNERANATVYKEVEFSLPKELNPQQQIELASSFVKHITDKNKLPYTFAIHSGIDKETGKINNPHCHLIFNERMTDNIHRDEYTHFRRANNKSPEKGGAKKLDLSKKDWLKKVRADWQEFANQCLRKYNIKDRIDHRTLKAQGILREPQIHLGKTSSYLLREKGKQNARADRYILIERLNSEIGALENELNREIKASQNDRGISTRNQTARSSIVDSDRRIYDYQSRIEKDSLSHGESQPRISEQLPSSDKKYERGSEGANDTSILANEDKMDSGERCFVSGQYSSHILDIVDLLPSQSNRSDPSLSSRDIQRWQPMDTSRQTEEIDFKNDRTKQAIYKQIKAMNCERVTISINTHKGVVEKDWTIQEVLANTTFLKKENAKGADIHIRPTTKENNGLILLDNLNQSQVKQLKTSGYEPCVVTETHPNHYQAWVRITNKTIDSEVATLLTKKLSEHLGNVNLSNLSNNGRLAGFTNRKPDYSNEKGQNPFVLLHTANNRIALKGEESTQSAINHIKHTKSNKEQESRLNRILEPNRGIYGAEKEYKRQAKCFFDKQGKNTDLSNLDSIVIQSMALTGKYTPKTLIETLEKHSPNILNNQASSIHEYAIKTVEKVMNSPEIIQAKEQQKNGRDDSLGMSL